MPDPPKADHDLPTSLYVRDGDRFVPTALTRGPWSAEAQHAGPPAALLGRALERLEPADGMRVGRFTLEILRPIPVAPVRVEARIVRPSKRVRFATATMSDEGGELARAAAWFLRVASGEVFPETGLEPPGFPGPAGSAELPVYEPPWHPSYFDSIAWRFARGSVFEPGPAASWTRLRVPLIHGEEPSPLTRVLVAADSANGISAVLPFDRYLFINLDLSIHLAREPRGEWVCLDAATRIDRDGIGFAESILWDEHGRIGIGAQSLLVARRDGSG